MTDNFTASCLLLYHTRMVIQKLQKCWIENPILLTCVKTIQNSAYAVVLDCFYMREIGLDFQSNIFEVIGLPQSFLDSFIWKEDKVLSFHNN